MRIDSHQHFWDISRSGYDWLTPDLEILYRNYQPVDIAPMLQRENISGTVLVQASDTVEETRYLLNIAAKTPFVLGVVGWVDLAAPNACQVIRELSTDSYLKGVRPMLQDIDQVDWILNDELKPALDLLAELGLTFDALITPRHFDVIEGFIAQNPELKIVIDHAAKPDFRAENFEKWAETMRSISAYKNVYCKLSGLWTEARGDVSEVSIRPYILHLTDCFGSKKLMWGSDWPVLNMAGEYSAWLDQVTHVLSGIPEFNHDDCFGKTAEHFYEL